VFVWVVWGYVRWSMWVFIIFWLFGGYMRAIGMLLRAVGRLLRAIIGLLGAHCDFRSLCVFVWGCLGVF
jgi:hypothetical protein